MDGIILHLLTRLDAIRETQLLQGQILACMAEAIAAPKTAAAPKRSRGSWMPIVAGAGQWAGAVLALAWIASGRDIGTAMAFLQKLF